VKLRQPQEGSDLAQSAVRAFTANERMNQLLLDHLNPAAWTAPPPGKVRTIATIFAHMHNVRTKWIRLSAPHLKVPRKLGRANCTPEQARAALAESAARCAEMLAEAMETSRGASPSSKGASPTSKAAASSSKSPARVTHFLRDGWAKPWPVGAAGGAGIEMLAYMLTHEAHHRGQVCMLAHQLGFALPSRVTSQLWNWERIWAAGR
jgi:uncharacterized damage-inducible protein DinB